MSTLVLVRHAQATPFEAETDRLSSLGVRQAEALATHWTTTGVDFDEVYSGTLERQRRTAEVVADAMMAAGRLWPTTTADTGFDEYDGDGIFGVLARELERVDDRFGELSGAARDARGTAEQNRHFQRMVEYVADRWMRGEITDPMVEAWPPTTTDTGFDEYDGDGIFGVLARQLAGRDADFRVLARAAHQARGTADQNRHFQRMVEHVADRWRRGELTDPVVEAWPAFCDRVDAAVDRILDGGRGRRVAVFTSGGVIGRTLQRVLRAPDETALALNWRVRNASLTQLTFSGRRVSLDAFNVTTHLLAAGLGTFP